MRQSVFIWLKKTLEWNSLWRTFWNLPTRSVTELLDLEGWAWSHIRTLRWLSQSICDLIQSTWSGWHFSLPPYNLDFKEVVMVTSQQFRLYPNSHDIGHVLWIGITFIVLTHLSHNIWQWYITLHVINKKKNNRHLCNKIVNENVISFKIFDSGK